MNVDSFVSCGLVSCVETDHRNQLSMFIVCVPSSPSPPSSPSLPQPAKDHHKLTCYYFNNKRNPRLLLRPIKVEVVFPEPRIYMLRDVISEPEMARLKELAGPKVHRQACHRAVSDLEWLRAYDAISEPHTPAAAAQPGNSQKLENRTV